MLYGLKSPCIGMCGLEKKADLCVGCWRSVDEITAWRKSSPATKLQVWKNTGPRRKEQEEQIWRDQMRRHITIKSPLKSIVSLVPSITHTLYTLGLQDIVTGLTRYCHDTNKTCIGGTKDLDHKIIKDLNPDLIIANKEENKQGDIEILSADFPIWISKVENLTEGMQLLLMLGNYFSKIDISLDILEKLKNNLDSLRGQLNSSFLYLIWKRPYMYAGADTFIQSWLTHLGLQPALDGERYPKLKLEDIQAAKPDIVFLPDEPYKFTQKDKEELNNILPNSKIILLPGMHFSWYGSAMLPASEFAKSLISDITD